MVKAVDLSATSLQQRVEKALRGLLLPKGNPGTDLIVIRSKEQGEKIIKTVLELMTAPTKIDSCYMLAQQDVIAEATQELAKAKHDSPTWPAQYGLWEKIPDYFIWSVIQKNYPEFTDNVVAKLTKAQKDICPTMLEVGTKLKAKDPVDTRLHDKETMSVFLQKLFEAHGHRLRGWVAKAFQDGKIDWWVGGPFNFKFDDHSVLKSLEWAADLGTILCLPDKQNDITKADHKLKKPANNLKCHVDLSMGPVFFSNLVDAEKNRAFSAIKSAGNLKQLAAEAAAEVNSRRQAASSNTITVSDSMVAAAKVLRKRKRPPSAPPAESTAGTPPLAKTD